MEEVCFSRAVGMDKQGTWTRWELVTGTQITWADLWKIEPHQFKFLVQSVYDVLPSPSNLFSWGLAKMPQCQLCQGKGTLEHILSSCPRALGDGRYLWRHDQVLRAVPSAVISPIASNNTPHGRTSPSSGLERNPTPSRNHTATN